MANSKYPVATTTGVVKQQNPNVFDPATINNPYAGSTNQGMYSAQSTPDYRYESGPTVQRADTMNGFDTMNVTPQLNDFQTSQANQNNWTYEQALSSPTDKGGMYEQAYMDNLTSETALRDAQITDLQGFDYMGAGSLAMQGLGTAMQMGLYGDRKDYMKNVNSSMEQNMRNAQESHDTRQANTASYGSAFSNA